MGFSMTAIPMTRLLQKNVKFEWSEVSSQFQKVERILN